MRLTIALSLLAVAVTALLAQSSRTGAQGTPRAGTPDAAAAIPPVVWQLASITLADGSEQAPDDPVKYTIQFLPDGFAAIVADCNQGTGPYSVEGNTLDISNILTTLVACPPESISDDYLQGLDEVVSYAFDEDALVLTLPDGGSLRFTLALTGVVWAWQGFQGGDDSEIVPDDPANYTIQFMPDGSVAVLADCNRGRGTYTADDAQIDISAIALTRMGCPPGSLGIDFATDLEAVNTFVFRDGNLYLALPVDSGIHEFVARVVEPDQATPTASPVAGG
ncbi:MAG: META domain-containing protein [Thermomicrobiales bacterium]